MVKNTHGRFYIKNRVIWLVVLLLVGSFITGCAQQTTKTTTVTLEEPEEPEREEVPATEETLNRALKELQDEMRVFDVEAYHDELYAQISQSATGSESDAELNQIIEPIVTEYIDLLLSNKIKEKLGENYSELDYEWLYNHVETTSLFKLMVAYEREYIKHKAK